jgi:hypothetical protein
MSRHGLDAFRQKVTVAWPKLQEETARKHLIAVASEGHARIMREQKAREGIAPAFEAYANRPGNADLDSVKLPGPIVFNYDYRAEIAYVTVQELRRASPHGSGKYRNAHALFVNGIATDGIPERLPPRAEIFVSNPVPYARRLEVGRTKSGRRFVLQVAPHIYERMADLVARRYKNTASIHFNYVQLPDAWRIRGRLSSFYATSVAARSYLRPRLVARKRRQREGELVRAPAIFIEPLT